MATPGQYDGIIIGSGQAGTPLASTLAKAGWKVALIEREHVGGTCVSEGCTPTKTMVASARTAYMVKRAAQYGIQAGPVAVDMTTVRRRKRDIVNSFREGSQKRLEQTDGVDLPCGEGSFTGPTTVQVRVTGGSVRNLTADKIFVNVGARPSRPSIAGLDKVPFLDSTSIMELDTVPEGLLIIGGGLIAAEFGQMFRRFGANVTIVHRRARLMPREDPDVSEELAGIFREDGIQLVLEADILSVDQHADGTVTLNVKTPQGDQALTGSHLLLAAGRSPNSDTLNLGAAGVTTDKQGFIVVNDRLEANVPGIYALGDVNGGPAHTHVAYDDFRIIRANLLEGAHASTRDRILPYTVFTDPQLGRVGLTEQAARSQGRNIRVAKMPMSYVARALEVDETRGFMKAIVDADSNQILGAAILGIEGGEMASLIQVAMMGRLPYTALRDGVFSHPTLSEALNNLFTYMED
jgi:pyruvate/2-oxoglutarate dehydrogenase complex dihydrolipoamide dehydrogenase (E3) component